MSWGIYLSFLVILVYWKNWSAISVYTHMRDSCTVQKWKLTLPPCIIIFNPPYVCSSPEEFTNSQTDQNLFAALSGGLSGLELTNKFLSHLPKFLADSGVCYLVLIDRNSPEDICLKLEEKREIQSAKVILTRRCGIENLCVVKIVKQLL